MQQDAQIKTQFLKSTNEPNKCTEKLMGRSSGKLDFKLACQWYLQQKRETQFWTVPLFYLDNNKQTIYTNIYNPLNCS